MNRINILAIEKALLWQLWQKFLKALDLKDLEKVRGHIIGIEKGLFGKEVEK